MFAKKQIQIDATQFTAGMATSDYTNDGGFGASSYGINPISVPGTIRALATPTDISANVVSHMIASCEDSQAIGANNRLFVDDSANYFTLSGTTLTKKHTGTATTKYTFGKTDMASFSGNTYITLSDNIALWDTSSDTLTESWWVGTKTQTALDSSLPHPMLVFENFLWIGDGPNLRNIDPSGTISSSSWTLNSNERIQALGIDPFTGLMLVSVQNTVNISDTSSSDFFVYLYDGYSTKPRRKIPVDDLVTAFYQVGNTVFVGMGNRLGYYNGNGISFLRTLTAANGNNLNLPYRHHFAKVGNTLLVADGAYVLAYGEIKQGGSKAFYYPFKNSNNSSTVIIDMIAPIGSSQFACSYYDLNGAKMVIADLASTASGSATFYTSNINFERPVFIRKIRVFTTGITHTNDSGVGNVSIIDENGNINHPAIQACINSISGSTRYVFDFDFSGLKLQMAQPRINLDTQAFGLIRVIIYYDIAE